MRPKQELLDEFLKEGNDGTFLEVFLDLRDLLFEIMVALQKGEETA